MTTKSTRQLLAALRKIRDEAAKGKPNPDKIFALAANAIAGHEALIAQEPNT